MSYNNNKCGCETYSDCECEVKDLGTKCVVYDGEYLPNTNIRKDTQLTDVLRILDEIVFEIRGESTTGSFINSVVNMGSGQGVYKTVDNLKRLQLKTLLTDSDMVTITSTENEVVFNIDQEKLSNFVKQTVRTVEVGYNDESVVREIVDTETSRNIYFKRILGGTNINITYGVDSITINAPRILSNNLIVSKIGNDYTIDAKAIKSDTLNIQETSTDININILTDGVKTFYVNNAYQGTTSDGTEVRPFKTIQEAINAYIGTGTNINPQFQSQKAVIRIKKGNQEYTHRGNLLVKDLFLDFENGVRADFTPTTGITLDFDSLPQTETKFKVTLNCKEGEVFIYTSKRFAKNTGASYGSADASYQGRNLTMYGVYLYSNASTYVVDSSLFSTSVADSIAHNHGDTVFYIDKCRITSQGHQDLFYLHNAGFVTIKNTYLRHGTLEFIGLNESKPIVFKFGYLKVENTEIASNGSNVQGFFNLTKGINSHGSVLDILNCKFSGNSKSMFLYSNENNKPALNLYNTVPLFDGFEKLISSPSLVTNATIINNTLSIKAGDVDLTKENTVSVTNYFEGKLKESLIKSPLILTTSNNPEGTPYIFTNNNSTDKSTWRRTVIFS